MVQNVVINNDALKKIIEQADQSDKTAAKSKGRPKLKVKKKKTQLYLPENVLEAIEKNCCGNKSVFAQTVFEFYFESKKIKY